MTELADVTVDVVVPTYRRPAHLKRCLSAIATQTRPAAQIVVVAREDDAGSHEVVRAAAERHQCLQLVTVNEPGVVAAMTAGVTATTAPLVAFTDDDAAPHPDWLARILSHFEDPTLGAVGGRDIIGEQTAPRTNEVGVFRRSGKLIGNHHLGTGSARDVDVLKGVNIAFRTDALALPRPGLLRGSGAQVDWEVVCCAHARQHGWRVVYDPSLLVDHEAAPRHDADQRLRPEASAISDSAYNSVVSWGADRSRWRRRAAFGALVGSTDRPGVGRTVAGLLRGETEVARRAVPSLRGQLAAFVSLLGNPSMRHEPAITAASLRQPSPHRPRVALVAHDIHDHGGMERACAELIRHVHHEFAFTVVSADLAPELRPLVDRWVRVRVPQRPFPLKFVTFFVRAGLALRRLDVDLVQTVGAIVPNRVDVAGIHFCHAGHRAATGRLAPGDAPALRRANTTLTRALALLAERWSYRPSSLRAFAAVSGGVAAELQRHYPRVPVTVTPNGIDAGRFRPDPDERSVMRDQHGVISGRTVALFLGGDWNRKALGVVLEAIAKARSEGADLVLWVVGSGDRRRFATRAEELGIAEAVTFFGPRADTQRFYQAADLFVLPSAYETFSLVCFEAAACGLPLVIPPLHGAGQLVGQDEAGLIVERDASDIARAMVTLAGNIELRSRLGAEARRRASAFTWEASAKAVTDLYRALLAVRSAR